MGVIHEQHVILRAPIPSFRIVREFSIEGMIGAQSIHQGGFVVRRAAHPAISHARPSGDGVTLTDDIFARTSDSEKFMGKAP
jgi:hypothetical protein